MDSDIPFWYNMVYYWCREKNRFGLTIPFILGISSIEKFSNYEIRIESLLNEIINYIGIEKIILRYCDDLDEYVLDFDHPYHSLSKESTSFGSLIIHPEILDFIKTKENLILFFENMYDEQLLSECYSKNLKTKNWERYSESDLYSIINALKSE